MVTDLAQITNAIIYKVAYFPSECAIANVGYCELDLHYQEQQFINVNISETVKANAKMRI